MGHGVARGPAEGQAQNKKQEQAGGRDEPYPAEDVPTGNGIRALTGEVRGLGFNHHSRIACYRHLVRKSR
jgi:hypothetical protein